jgi:hypothetical protein
MNLIYRIKWWLKCKKYKKHIKYWRENPDVFCEKYLGIKLYDFQKKLLREMNKHPEKFCPHGDRWDDCPDCRH